jgi:hypothetical protein
MGSVGRGSARAVAHDHAKRALPLSQNPKLEFVLVLVVVLRPRWLAASRGAGKRPMIALRLFYSVGLVVINRHSPSRTKDDDEHEDDFQFRNLGLVTWASRPSKLREASPLYTLLGPSKQRRFAY